MLDEAIIGNSPNDLNLTIRNMQKIAELGFDEITVTRVEGLTDDLDGTRKIIAKF